MNIAIKAIDKLYIGDDSKKIKLRVLDIKILTQKVVANCDFCSNQKMSKQEITFNKVHIVIITYVLSC